MSYSKQFSNNAAASAFIDSLQPCSSITRRFNATGTCTVSWEPMRLRMTRINGAFTCPSRVYPVQREIEHAYLVRDDLGQMIKVNRYTLMSGTMKFEIE